MCDKSTSINRLIKEIFIKTGAHCVVWQSMPNHLLIASDNLISKKQNRMFGVLLILVFTAWFFDPSLHESL